MGTPEFAVETLRVILEAGYNVVAVMTAPDKPAGRGQKLKFSPVKEFALIHHLPILQPINLKDSEFIDTFRSYNSNLQIVVAFRMLPEVIWQIPEYGSVNLHASLLPQYRGAAPINHVLINGETETGLTTFFIEKEIDTGNIILSKKVIIEASDNAGTLHNRLMIEGGKLVLKTIDLIENDDVNTQSQAMAIFDQTDLKTAPKIFKGDCRINWHASCKSIHNLIRGLSPFPGAYAFLRYPDGTTKQVKIFKTTYFQESQNKTPGSIITDNKTTFSVVANNGRIQIEELQIEGKRALSISDFLRGMHFSEDFHFE
jgi:methionyl-tRNA formyltransferase